MGGVDIYIYDLRLFLSSAALIDGCCLISHRISLDGCLGVGIKRELNPSNEYTAPPDTR